MPVEIQGSSKKMLDLAAGIWSACLSKETVLTSFSAAVLHGTCARGDVVLLASAVQEFEGRRSIVLLVLPWARQVCGASLDLGRKI